LLEPAGVRADFKSRLCRAERIKYALCRHHHHARFHRCVNTFDLGHVQKTGGIANQ